MTYRLRFDRQFMRQLETLPGDIRRMARQQIQSLPNNPQPTQAKELDDHPLFFRLWLPRDYRLVWVIIEDEQVVDLLYVGPKLPNLYERLGLGRK